MMLQDKKAIVTGGGRGLGKAIALLLAQEGADVAVWGRTKETIDRTAKEIEATGRDGVSMQVDVSKSSQVNKAVDQLLERWGRVDILVNNAAVLPQIVKVEDPAKANPFLDMTDERWAEEIAVDLSGVFYCIRAVTRPMMEQRWGRIINIGSLAGINGGYFSTPSYSAAKAGIMGMTMLAARWLGRYGITVNVVHPGPIITEGAQFSEDVIQVLGKTIPFRRNGDENEILGKPEDIAKAVLYFASDLAPFVTGTKINVIGGQHMG